MHLIIDGFCKNQQLLTDAKQLKLWLRNTVVEIGMSILAGPDVYEFDVEVAEGPYKGLTGIVILAESHISVHTFPEYRYAFIDVFSCFWFDAKKASEVIRDVFNMEDSYREMAIERSIEEVR